MYYLEKSIGLDKFLRRNCLLHDVIEGRMTELEGVRRRRRRKQIFDNLKNRRYWELKKEAEY